MSVRGFMKLAGGILLVVATAVVLSGSTLDKGVAERSVVKLVNPSNHNSGGTGFAIRAPSGRVYTMTNAHVCRANVAGRMQGMTRDGRTFFLNIIEIGRDTDLCILESVPGKEGLEMGAPASVYQYITVIGHPLLEEVTRTSGYITGFGIVQVAAAEGISDEACAELGGSNFADIFGTVCVRKQFAGRVTANIFPGNSGSPILNGDGYVVGVAFAGSSRTNFGYIITYDDLKKFLSIY